MLSQINGWGREKKIYYLINLTVSYFDEYQGSITNFKVRVRKLG